MNKKEIIEKIENLLFRTNGDFEKSYDLLSIVRLTENYMKSCLEEIVKEYNNLLTKVSWSCGITQGGAQGANVNSLNDVFKLCSKKLALAVASDRKKSYDQELFKKYKKEDLPRRKVVDEVF
ncbi:MAG: hypothetical protein PV340_00815 [Wolbachia sp.]|nr:hypothetical protein [Wolbachia sp.]MDD9336336.1 hypothetical protein [Wolbachia sp.]